MSATENEQSDSWIQRLKNESWEAELLISTVAIFGSFQLFNLLDRLTCYLIDVIPPSQYLIGSVMVFIGTLAVSILTSMFIIHFLLRAYWVGVVGLNSVFPDYGLEDSAYSEVFTKKMLSVLPTLKKTIKDVDELSSVIFSAAFFMMFVYVFMSLAAGIYLFVYNRLVGSVSHFILMIPIYLLLTLFTLQMIIATIANLKVFKQNEKIQTLFYQSNKWGYLLTAGPFYKQAIQIGMTFVSNFKKKKSLTGLIIVFISVGFFISLNQSDNGKMKYLARQDIFFNSTKIYNEFYASRSSDQAFLLAPQIDTDITASKIIRLFIPVYTYEFNNLAQAVCGEFVADKEATRLASRKASDEWYLNCYTKYNHVYLNDNRVPATFTKYNLAATNQFGIITYIDLENQPRGSNTIKVIKDLKDNKLEWEIPFQYSPNSNK